MSVRTILICGLGLIKEEGAIGQVVDHDLVNVFETHPGKPNDDVRMAWFENFGYVTNPSVIHGVVVLPLMRYPLRCHAHGSSGRQKELEEFGNWHFEKNGAIVVRSAKLLVKIPVIEEKVIEDSIPLVFVVAHLRGHRDIGVRTLFAAKEVTLSQKREARLDGICVEDVKNSMLR